MINLTLVSPNGVVIKIRAKNEYYCLILGFLRRNNINCKIQRNIIKSKPVNRTKK